MSYSEGKRSTTNKSITIIATIVTDNGSVYENITVDTFDTEGVLFNETHYIAYSCIVEINVRNVPE